MFIINIIQAAFLTKVICFMVGVLVSNIVVVCQLLQRNSMELYNHTFQVFLYFISSQTSLYFHFLESLYNCNFLFIIINYIISYSRVHIANFGKLNAMHYIDFQSQCIFYSILVKEMMFSIISYMVVFCTLQLRNITLKSLNHQIY